METFWGLQKYLELLWKVSWFSQKTSWFLEIVKKLITYHIHQSNDRKSATIDILRHLRESSMVVVEQNKKTHLRSSNTRLNIITIIISVFIFHERKVEISYDFPTRSFSMPSFKLFSSQSLFFFRQDFASFFRVCGDGEEEEKTFFMRPRCGWTMKLSAEV